MKSLGCGTRWNVSWLLFPRNIFFFAGVYGCLNVCGHMYVYMCMSFMLRPKVDSMCLPPLLSHVYFMREGLSVEPRTHRSASLAGQRGPASPCLCLLRAEGKNVGCIMTDPHGYCSLSSSRELWLMKFKCVKPQERREMCSVSDLHTYARAACTLQGRRLHTEIQRGRRG